MPSNYTMNPLSFHQFSSIRSHDYEHPTITRVQKNMKKAFKKSMREIQTELNDYQLYRENYDFMMFSPMAIRFTEKITELTAQNAELQYANRKMQKQLLEYDQLLQIEYAKLIPKPMGKTAGKNIKSLRKLAKKQKKTRQLQESDSVEENTRLSEDIDTGHDMDRTPEVDNVVEENISFELTEDIVSGHDKPSTDTIQMPDIGTSVDVVALSCDDKPSTDKSRTLPVVPSSGVLATEYSGAEDEEVEEEEVAESEAEEEEEVAESEAEEEEAEEEEAEEEAEEEEAEEEAEEEEAESEAEEEVAESEEADEEEADESEEVAESEAEEEVYEEEEAEEEVYEVQIGGKQYFTTNEKNGVIYAMDSEGEVGDEIGKYIAGVATFSK